MAGDASLPTKKRKHQSSSFSIKRGSTDYLQQYRISSAAASPAGSKNEQQAASLEEGKAKQSKRSHGFSTGFLGPSSYWSAFEEPEESSGNNNNSNSNSRILAQTPVSSSEQATDAHTVDVAEEEEDMESPSADMDQIEAGARILALLEDLPLFQTMIQVHYERHPPWIFGERMTREVFAGFISLRNQWVPDGAKTKNYKSKMRAWSKHIFDNSATTIYCHARMTPSEYFSGIAPRWETIGLMFSWVGQSTSILDNHECLRLENSTVVDKHKLKALIIEALETCLSFCDKVGTISDPLLWLLILHDVVLINTYGDGGMSTLLASCLRCCVY